MGFLLVYSWEEGVGSPVEGVGVIVVSDVL